MIIIRAGSIIEEDTSNMASSNNLNVNHFIETSDVKDAFIQVNEVEKKKKRQAEELAQFKDQVATLHRLVQG